VSTGWRLRPKGAQSEEGELTVSFDGGSVTYGFGELDTLVPAYAASFHKSQGSEYPAAVIPVITQHYAMLQRNLLYTGVTRGKRLVVLVGQKKPSLSPCLRHNLPGLKRHEAAELILGGAQFLREKPHEFPTPRCGDRAPSVNA
jgi:exodeoxyribonuclease V alpha subunit